MTKTIDRVVFDAKVSDRKILLIPVKTLRHTPYNPPSRTKEGAKLKQLAESVKKYGLAYPVLITPERNVIDGNRRLTVAKQLGKEFVECIIFSGDKDAVFRSLNTTAEVMGGKAWLVVGRKGGELQEKHKVMYDELLSLIGTYGVDLLIAQNVGLNILPLCKSVCAQGTSKGIAEVIMKTAINKLSNKLNFILRSGKPIAEKVFEIDALMDRVSQ